MLFFGTSWTFGDNCGTDTFQYSTSWKPAPLLGIAEVLNNEGDEEFRKNELKNAIHSYTEGIDVQCEDKELNAKLYSNRATAHCFLGEYTYSVFTWRYGIHMVSQNNETVAMLVSRINPMWVELVSNVKNFFCSIKFDCMPREWEHSSSKAGHMVSIYRL